MGQPFFTIGHSDRSLSEFIRLLRDHDVRRVVDVRKLPGSNRYPHFNQDELSVALGESGIGYRHSTGLAGRRPVSRTVPDEVNAWWENQSFHNYADHALSSGFGQALAELRREVEEGPVSVMCSEAVWWRCHRRIIADYLLARGDQVLHIIGGKRVEPAGLTSGGVVQDDLKVTYPAAS